LRFGDLGERGQRKRRLAVGTMQRIFSAEYRGEQNEEKAAFGKRLQLPRIYGGILSRVKEERGK